MLPCRTFKYFNPSLSCPDISAAASIWEESSHPQRIMWLQPQLTPTNQERGRSLQDYRKRSALDVPHLLTEVIRQKEIWKTQAAMGVKAAPAVTPLQDLQEGPSLQEPGPQLIVVLQLAAPHPWTRMCPWGSHQNCPVQLPVAPILSGLEWLTGEWLFDEWLFDEDLFCMVCCDKKEIA